jgi:hypothetical protein
MHWINKQRLFDILTIELLAHKYLYYIKGYSVISDTQYDNLEKLWEVEGYRLGFNMPNYKWVDFPDAHYLAQTAIAISPDAGVETYNRCIGLVATKRV